MIRLISLSLSAVQLLPLVRLHLCFVVLLVQGKSKAKASAFSACCLPLLQVLSYAPDVLLLCPCSRSTAAAMPDVTRLTQQPGFRDLPAVKSGRVYVIDHSYFSRPGPRLVDGAELLYKLLWEDCAAAAVHAANAASSDSKQLASGSVCCGGESGARDDVSKKQHVCCDCDAPVTDFTGPACKANGAACALAGASAVHEVLRIHCTSDKDVQWLPL